jgi:2-dehydro-3-deoxyphosphogluconate aldolase/(4S)-4-hydroxy-2-oxoglutarate aldolase
MKDIIEKIGTFRIVPVVAIHSADNATLLADALIQGGLECAEITFRTDAAAKSIQNIAKRDDILVGAGTVLKIDQVKQAMDAGAQFIVSPGFNPKIVEFCLKKNILVTPGTSNPTDIEMALEFGLDVVKFFPAEAFGGLKTLKAISAPYNMVKYIPTGGINADNLANYLEFPKVLACGGSWMVKSNLIQNKQFDEISRLTREAVNIAASVQ